jgi:AcrR family transcriptional regulator
VQVIADALRVGKGTIYRHYATKRALFLAAVDRGMHKLREAVEAAVERCDDPLQQIACAVRAYLEFFAEHPELVELLIQERAEFRDRQKPTYFIHREQGIARWQRLYRQLIADGRVRKMPVDRILDVMSGLVYGTMFISFFAGQKKSPKAQAADILDVIFYGLLTPPEGARKKGSGLVFDLPKRRKAVRT